MKYILSVIIFAFLLQIICSNVTPTIESQSTNQHKVLEDKRNDFVNRYANDSFSFEGNIVSSILPSFVNASTQQNHDQQLKKNTTIQNNPNLQPSIPNYNEINESSSSSRYTDLLSEGEQSDNGLAVNNTDNLSENLVSMLSGIIIQSIENGNPTLVDEEIVLDADLNNTNRILLTGRWNIDIANGNVSNFQARFIMISTNGTGLHWHSLNNFQTIEKLYLGDDNNAIVKSKVDFFTGSNSTKKTTDIIFTVVNSELIQITFLDNEVASHFYNFPIYGTIDSIKIYN